MTTDVFLKYDLNKHVESVHERKKPFKCNNICDYSCSQKGHLKPHVASVHEVKKPFKCNIYYCKCSQNNIKNNHVESIHERKKPFKCGICNNSVSR